MLERFTRQARATVERAQDEARALGARTVEAEHLLLALADLPVLREAGAGHERLLAALDREHEQALAAVGVAAGDYDAPIRPTPGGHLRFGTSAKLALERSLKETVRRGDRRIVAEHLLLGLLAAEAGTVPRALRSAELDRDALAAAAERAIDART